MMIGLCETCRFHAIVTNNRGGEFHLCELSKTDPSYAKYPRLPVFNCTGYSSAENMKEHEEERKCAFEKGRQQDGAPR